ncbi:hypothetical protein ACCO45_007786 [Purpureocillium lilacinum]|uniref:Uncharacterized protein n=1 Tax=Purpureocillium lilacinum TaxID=33203 RepID=A0ACC4DM55_PURLI
MPPSQDGFGHDRIATWRLGHLSVPRARGSQAHPPAISASNVPGMGRFDADGHERLSELAVSPHARNSYVAHIVPTTMMSGIPPVLVRTPMPVRLHICASPREPQTAAPRPFRNGAAAPPAPSSTRQERGEEGGRGARVIRFFPTPWDSWAALRSVPDQKLGRPAGPRGVRLGYVRERWARGGGDMVGICAVRKDTTGGSQTGRTSGAKMFEDPLAAMHAAQGFTAMMD